MSGETKFWKTKQRMAPYLLAPYVWDPQTSVGGGPPTAVTVTAFDPLTPEAQLRVFFGSFGDIAELENKMDPNTGAFLGICYVRYRDTRSMRGPVVTGVEAALRAEREGHKQRVGLSTVRVERDAGGKKCKRYVERVAQKNKERLEREMRERPKEIIKEAPATRRPSVVDSELAPIGTPPPNAPKGPSGLKPPEGPRGAAAAWTPHSIIETEAILPKIKRKPYIHISQEHVPVMGTTIPHLQKRMKDYSWEEIRCDQSGYYVIFENSKRGEEEAIRCYKVMNERALFTYTMIMECQQYGNPNYERTPSPERALAMQREKEREDRLKLEDEMDLEEEKKQRALDLDPVKAALEQLRIELRDKILNDVRTRIAAPALYDFLDPARHVARRQKLGIADPAETQRTPTILIPGIDSLSKTPRPGSSGDFRKDLLASKFNMARLKHEESVTKINNAFVDERRQGPARRRPAPARNLHQRLQDFYQEQSSDDDSAERDQDDDSRSESCMSSVAPVAERDDETSFTPRKRRRLERRSPTRDDESADEHDSLARSVLEQDVTEKDPEDMNQAELENLLASLPSTSKVYQQAKAELRLRLQVRVDDHLFDVKTEAQSVEQLVQDAGLVDEISSTDIVQTTENLVDLKSAKRKIGKSKKKSKKQIFEEREAAKAEAANRRSQVVEEEVTVPDVKIIPEEPEKIEEEEEARAEVEWGVSTDVPRRTVEDDDAMVLDIDGWQHILKDNEDLTFLKLALVDEPTALLADPNLWAFQQKEIKALNTGGNAGITHEAAAIQGYYIPNATGSARTEGYKKILESEKSKYLPHRIKVAKAREERERLAAAGISVAPAQNAEAARQAKMKSSAHSRSNRASNRTHVKDIQIVKQNLTTDGQQGDAIRFNQLKKRKKLVKFDRSAIHGWGLYAEENIAMGDMIIEYVGERVRQAVATIREARYDKQGMGSSYLFRIDEDSIVDATKKGGIARFINHSCAPNCTAKIIRVEGTKRIVIYALKDILKSKFLLFFLMNRLSLY